MNKSTEMNAREQAYYEMMIEKACGEYLCMQDYDDTGCENMYEAYQKLKRAVDKNEGFCLADDYVDVVERFNHLTVQEMIDSIESSFPIENDNLPPHVINIDWELLRKQKLSLVKTITYLAEEKNSLPNDITDDLTGILHMIDSLQDDAVDIYGLEEERVFGTPEQD